MNIQTVVFNNHNFCTIIKLDNGIEIEIYGVQESLTINDPSGGCFDFHVNKDGKLGCEGQDLREALDNSLHYQNT